MKELVFRVAISDTADRQVFPADVEATSRTVHVPDDTLYQLWEVSGSKAALDTLRGGSEETVEPHLGTAVLQEQSRSMEVVTKWRRPLDDDPTTVPHLLARLAWARTLARLRMHRRTLRVRAVDEDCAKLSELLATVTDRFSSRFDVDLVRKGRIDEPVDDADLAPDDRRLLDRALRDGYYEEPKECDIRELGDQIGLSRSTVSRRLRRLEKAGLRMLRRRGAESERS